VSGFARRAAHVLAALALGACALFSLGAAPAGAADPVGYVILQGEAECGLAQVDLVTGALTELGSFTPAKCAFDLEFTPDGTRLLGTHVSGTSASLVEFDLTTGDVTTLSALGDFTIGGPGSSQGNLTFSTGGALYTYLVPLPPEPAPGSTAVDPACDGSAFCLFQVDQTDPTNLTYVNHVPQEFTVYSGLATSCAGVTSSAHEEFSAAGTAQSWGGPSVAQPGDQTLATVNLTSTGPATTDVAVIPDAFLDSLDYNSAGTLYGVGFATDASTPSLFTVDPATAAATEVHGFTLDGDPINIGVLGFAIAHPCAPTPTPPPPTPPAPAPAAVVVTPRFTG
jgi:hypothetical protein